MIEIFRVYKNINENIKLLIDFMCKNKVNLHFSSLKNDQLFFIIIRNMVVALWEEVSRNGFMTLMILSK